MHDGAFCLKSSKVPRTAANPILLAPRGAEKRTINNMIIGGGTGAGGRAPAIVEKGVAKPAFPVTGSGPFLLQRGSLCQADIPEASSSRNRPCRPVPDRLRFSRQPHIRSSDYVWQRSGNPSPTSSNC